MKKLIILVFISLILIIPSVFAADTYLYVSELGINHYIDQNRAEFKFRVSGGDEAFLSQTMDHIIIQLGVKSDILSTGGGAITSKIHFKFSPEELKFVKYSSSDPNRYLLKEQPDSAKRIYYIPKDNYVSPKNIHSIEYAKIKNCVGDWSNNGLYMRPVSYVSTNKCHISIDYMGVAVYDKNGNIVKEANKKFDKIYFEFGPALGEDFEPEDDGTVQRTNEYFEDSTEYATTDDPGSRTAYCKVSDCVGSGNSCDEADKTYDNDVWVCVDGKWGKCLAANKDVIHGNWKCDGSKWIAKPDDDSKIEAQSGYELVKLDGSEAYCKRAVEIIAEAYSNIITNDKKNKIYTEYCEKEENRKTMFYGDYLFAFYIHPKSFFFSAVDYTGENMVNVDFAIDIEKHGDNNKKIICKNPDLDQAECASKVDISTTLNPNRRTYVYSWIEKEKLPDKVWDWFNKKDGKVDYKIGIWKKGCVGSQALLDENKEKCGDNYAYLVPKEALASNVPFSIPPQVLEVSDNGGNGEKPSETDSGKIDAVKASEDDLVKVYETTCPTDVTHCDANKACDDVSNCKEKYAVNGEETEACGGKEVEGSIYKDNPQELVCTEGKRYAWDCVSISSSGEITSEECRLYCAEDSTCGKVEESNNNEVTNDGVETVDCSSYNTQSTCNEYKDKCKWDTKCGTGNPECVEIGQEMVCSTQDYLQKGDCTFTAQYVDSHGTVQPEKDYWCVKGICMTIDNKCYHKSSLDSACDSGYQCCYAYNNDMSWCGKTS